MKEQSNKKVVIGIQARSSSERLPEKNNEQIGRLNVLQHVLQACHSSLGYINAYSSKSGIEVKLCLLIPEDDPIKDQVKKVDIIEGDMDDVLSRYICAGMKYNPHYFVRITADCPLIPPFLITKIINSGVRGSYDYLSNVDDRFRTFADGHDVELFSAKALKFLNDNATEASDKEHVTTLLRSNPPEDFKIGTIIGHLDLSSVKLSIDEEEDLIIARQQHTAIQHKLKEAQKLYGKQNIHRF